METTPTSHNQAGNHSASRRSFLRLSRVLPTSRVFTSGYVNTETILHFFYKVTNERGTKTVFTYAHVKWFHGQSERAYYLNYFIICYVIFLAFFLGVTDFQERDRAIIRFTYSYFQFRVMWIKGLLPPPPLNSHMNPA